MLRTDILGRVLGVLYRVMEDSVVKLELRDDINFPSDLHVRRSRAVLNCASGMPTAHELAQGVMCIQYCYRSVQSRYPVGMCHLFGISSHLRFRRHNAQPGVEHARRCSWLKLQRHPSGRYMPACATTT